MRIEWDPLDSALLTVQNGALTIHRGPAQQHIAGTAPWLDARWLTDGPILGLDSNAGLSWFRDGKRVEYRTSSEQIERAALAADGTKFVALHFGAIVVVDLAGPTFRPRLDGVTLDHSGATMEISGDGARLAIAYETEQPGRGFAVFDLESHTVLERSWQSQPLHRLAPVGLAFDHAGKRLAQAIPEDGVPALGVLRIKGGDRYPRTRTGGATAVAIEYRGNLVAYAHRVPLPGARGRLQFDYLESGVKGAEIVGVLDTQTLESELPDLVALAFSRDRRRLACLASNGAVEVVPVP